MHCTRKVTEDIIWIGGSDRRLALFENVFPIPRGVSYNSYLLKDEKTVLLDTVDRSIAGQFLENLAFALDGRNLDYMIVNHMEPDHCALIEEIVRRYPEVKVVGNAKTFGMIQQFYAFDITDRSVTVKEGETLNTGKHTLHFVMAPMVHWPEVMVTYDETDKVLFSADAFGTFGALNGNIFNDEIDFDRDWLDDARRYYTNIVGKYGGPVQTTLKKAAGLDISIICPLHGPIWRSNLGYILDKYNTWSSYEPEEKAVMIAYASMYGNTENLANVLAAKLAEADIHNIVVYDVSNTHVSTLISEAFRCSHIVLAAPTYNGNVYPVMENFLNDMKALAVQKRTVAILDNGTWAATAGKQMADKIAEMKDMKIIEPKVSIKSSLKNEQLEQLDELVAEIKKDF
ncbi:FprA family A-type flavoprotein [Roseburia sp. OM04-10BH]|jgi:flavorubredoxin|uniref:FprA family A-type flavoprotein n=1 Tax=unclassified Roseburia TaxID=2637578 RepID=UPI000E4C8A04|nr:MULTISPECIES: FprA family A-type flavoprotein [unclassified Roseburia]RGI46425.1 FprA family A-type flavoprotein [Roseburia sp. OM04-10BH]RHV43703.1 FprA family A-type flavoprotein [Roseburia sp. OM04-15AA]